MMTKAAINPTTIPAMVPPDRLFLDCEEPDAPAAYVVGGGSVVRPVASEDVRAATKATVGPAITYGDSSSRLNVYVPGEFCSERQ